MTALQDRQQIGQARVRISELLAALVGAHGAEDWSRIADRALDLEYHVREMRRAAERMAAFGDWPG